MRVRMPPLDSYRDLVWTIATVDSSTEQRVLFEQCTQAPQPTLFWHN